MRSGRKPEKRVENNAPLAPTTSHLAKVLTLFGRLKPSHMWAQNPCAPQPWCRRAGWIFLLVPTKSTSRYLIWGPMITQSLGVYSRT
jgi:hypothetical protein